MTAGRPSPGVRTELKAATGRLDAGPPGSEYLVKVGGDWRLSEPFLSWTSVLGARTAASVALNSHGDDTLDFEVAIRVVACEGVRCEDGHSSIHFAVTWETRSVEKNSMVATRGAFAAGPVAWNGKECGQLAERLSEAVAGMSGAVAADLPMEAKTPHNNTAEETTP